MSTSGDIEHKSTAVDSYCGAFGRRHKVSPLAASSSIPDVADTQPQQYFERGEGEMLVDNSDRCEKREPSEPTDVNVDQSVVYATATGFFDWQNGVRFPESSCHQSSAIVTDTLAETISRMKTFVNGCDFVAATTSSASSAARKGIRKRKHLLPTPTEFNPTNADSKKMTDTVNDSSLILPPNVACGLSVALTSSAASGPLPGTSVSLPLAASLRGTTGVDHVTSALQQPSSIANPQLSMTSSSNALFGVANVLSTDEEPVPIFCQLPAKRQFSVFDEREASVPIFVENQPDCSAVELKQTSQTVSIGSTIVEQVSGPAFDTVMLISSGQPVTSCPQLPQQQQTFSDGIASSNISTKTGNSGSVGRAAVKFLLRRQMAMISDVIGQLVAEVNTVASFLGQTRPPELDSRERAMMESMQSISTTLKTLTPVCAAYRRLGDEILTTSQGGGSGSGNTYVWNDVRRLPSAKCLSRHEKMLKGCRDRMSVVLSERRRLVMQTPIAEKQRQMTHDWLLRHRQTIIDSITIVDDVMKAVLEPPAEEPQLTQQQSNLEPADSVANAPPPTLSVFPSAAPAASTSISSTVAVSSSGRHAVTQKALHSESLPSVSAFGHCQHLVNRKSRKVASTEEKVLYRVLCKIFKKLDRKVKGEIKVHQLSTASPERLSRGSSCGPIFEHTADAITSDPSKTVETKPRSFADIKPQAVNSEKNTCFSVFASRPETIIFDADVHDSTTVKAEESRPQREALPPLNATCGQRIALPVNDEPPAVLPFYADTKPTKSKQRKKKNRTDAETRIKKMILSILPQLLKSVEVDAKGGYSSTNSIDTIDTLYSQNSITPCITAGENMTVADPTAAVSDPASSDVPKEGGKNKMTLGNEQLKTMLEERDQQTFSRLLVDSVCSLTPSDFERVWQTLIQKLMENRLRAKSSAGDSEDESMKFSDGHCAHLPLIDSTVTHNVVSRTESCDVTTRLQSPCRASPSLGIKTEGVRSSVAELDDVDRFPCDSPTSVSVNADVITEQTIRRPKRTEFGELITVHNSDENDDVSMTSLGPTNVITIAPLDMSDDECDYDRRLSCSNYNDTTEFVSTTGGSVLTDLRLQNINSMCERTLTNASKDDTFSSLVTAKIDDFATIDREGSGSADTGVVSERFFPQQVVRHDTCSNLCLSPHQLIPSATNSGRIVDDSFFSNIIVTSTALPRTSDGAPRSDDCRQLRSFSSAESDQLAQQSCQPNSQFCSTPHSSTEQSSQGGVVIGVSDLHARDGSTTIDRSETPRYNASRQLFLDPSPRSPDRRDDVTCLHAHLLSPRYRSPPSVGGCRQIDSRTLDREHDGSCSVEMQRWLESQRQPSPQRLSPRSRSAENFTMVRATYGEEENAGHSPKLALKSVVEQSRSITTTSQCFVEEDEKCYRAPPAILTGRQHVTQQSSPSSPVLRHQRKRKWPQSPVASLPCTPTASPLANELIDDVFSRMASKLQRQCDELGRQLSNSTAAAAVAGAGAAVATPPAPHNTGAASDTTVLELSEVLASGTAAASRSSCVLEDIIKSTEVEIQQIRLEMEKSFLDRQLKTPCGGIEQQRKASPKLASESTQDSMRSDQIGLASTAHRGGGCPTAADRPQTLRIVANRNEHQQRKRVEQANKTDESEKKHKATSGKAAEIGVVLGHSTDSLAPFRPNRRDRYDTDTTKKMLITSKHKRQQEYDNCETSTDAGKHQNENQSDVRNGGLLPYGSPFSTESSENDVTAEGSTSQVRFMDAPLQIAFNRSSVDWQSADAASTRSLSTSSEDKIALTRTSAGKRGSHGGKRSYNRCSHSLSSNKAHIERLDDEKVITIRSHSERSLIELSTARSRHGARYGGRYRRPSYGENRQRCRSLQSPEFNLASRQLQQRGNSQHRRRPHHRRSRSRSRSRSTSTSLVLSSARTDFRTRLKDSVSPTRRKFSESSFEIAVSGRGFSRDKRLVVIKKLQTKHK